MTLARRISREDLTRARRIAGEDAELESAAAEALVRAAESFDGRGSWEGYSGQRMSWAVRDARRRRATWNNRTRPMPETWEQASPEKPALPVRVEEAVNALPEDQRAALLNGPLDRRRRDVRDGLAALRRALGVDQ